MTSDRDRMLIQTFEALVGTFHEMEEADPEKASELAAFATVHTIEAVYESLILSIKDPHLTVEGARRIFAANAGKLMALAGILGIEIKKPEELL